VSALAPAVRHDAAGLVGVLRLDLDAVNHQPSTIYPEPITCNSRLGSESQYLEPKLYEAASLNRRA